VATSASRDSAVAEVAVGGGGTDPARRGRLRDRETRRPFRADQVLGSLEQGLPQVAVVVAAPYRHFRDAESLLAEVATRGFDAFRDRLAAALNAAQPTDPPEPPKPLAAPTSPSPREEPAFYAAMFEAPASARSRSPTSRPPVTEPSPCSEPSPNRLSAVARIQPRPPALMIALHLWSTAHGIASLFGRADPSRRPLPMSAEDLLEASMLIYLQGLGVNAENRLTTAD